jgi:hypothetical protein
MQMKPPAILLLLLSLQVSFFTLPAVAQYPAPPMCRSLFVSDTDEKITEMRPANVKQLHRSENCCGRL